ncbi:chorion class high cysteine protein 12 [Echinococcus multilocularis]|uniref:Chorion class high cysteine protein 12 n=1 Tax=Echinococcus multilocularis TaxID=6211 RepID=A0A0S4MJ48_ECHMU|nr:chorion class high cysteine protein 12 [Echinococcus multilocularis]
MEELKPQTKMHIVSKLCGKVGNAMEWTEARRNDGSGMWSEYGSGWEGIDAIQDLEAEVIMRCVQDCGYCARPTMDDGYVFDPIPIKDVAVYDDSMNWQPQLPTPATSVSSMDPLVLRSIILNMPNLNDILMQVDPVYLQSALVHVPGFGAYASSMDAYTLHSMIVGLPYVRDIVASMDARLLQRMIAHIPNIDAILFGGNAVISQPTMPDMPRKAPRAEEPDAKTTEVAGGMSDEANIMDRKFMEYIISTMPNVPTRFANVLLHVKPDYVRYIIEKHGNLHGLLAKMNAQTLQYVIAHVPKFGVILSNMNRNTLKVVFDKLPNIAKFLADMNPRVVRAIVAKLPSLARYALVESTTTPPQENPTLVSKMVTEVAEGTPTTFATQATVFTDEDHDIERSETPSTDYIWKTPNTKYEIPSSDPNENTTPESITTALHENPTLVSKMDMEVTEMTPPTITSNAPMYTDEDLDIEQSEIPSIDGASKRPNVEDEVSGGEVDTYTPPQAITTTPQNNPTPLFSMVMKVTEGAPTTATTETRDPADVKFDLIRSKIPLIDLPLRLHDPSVNPVISQLTMPNMPRPMPMAEGPDAKVSQADSWMCDQPNSMDRKSMEYFMSTMLQILT